MFNFNLEDTDIFQAVKWAKDPTFRFAGPLKGLFFILFILTSLIFLYGFLLQTISDYSLRKILAISIISLTLTITFQISLLFFNLKLKRPKLKITIDEVIKKPEDFNLAEFLSFESARTVWKSIKFSKSKKILEVNSSVLFHRLLKDNPKLNFIFSRLLLNLNEIKNILKSHLLEVRPRPDSGDRVDLGTISLEKSFQNSILESLKIAQKKGHERIEIGDMLTAVSKHDLVFEKILIDSKLKVQDIENLTWWLESLEEKIAERKRFWEYRNLIKKGSLAKEWAAGYTITLDKFSMDLTKLVRERNFPEVIGHEVEIKEIERILARRETNNVLLVGEPGVGRKSIVQGLAARSCLGQCLPEVNYKRVVDLDIPAILAHTQNREEVEVILDRIFQEVVSAGNVILVINNFHNFVRTEIQPGVVDISGTLSAYLDLPQFQIITISTFAGLHKYIERKPGILGLFEKIEVSEISERETLMFLERLVFGHEQRYKKFISYPALREIISLANRYLPALPFPKKAIGLLDEVMVYVALTKDKIVLPEHVAKIVSERTQIPVGEIEVKEKEILLDLENLIHQRIINQDEAVKEVSTALRRARAEVTIRKGPMGTFLFMGPTGVGKTETSKALAEIYFGSEQRMIRMDMSEFQSVEDISRLIGSSKEDGLLTTQVRENPFSLILLDEIEKTHPNILNLFLQVLDEGSLTDGLGRKVSFKNSIIIATSNAGYQIILEAIKAKTEWFKVKNKILDYVFENAVFRPEFINRFDAIVVFQPLSKDNLLDIAELLLQKLKKNLKEKGIEFIINFPLKEKIVELGYNPTFGAREMKRVIQDKVENVLAVAILSDKLKRGQKAEIDSEGFKLIIK